MDQNERTVGVARPEYVDFDVDGFLGGLPACLEAVLMVCDQPQQAADLARVLAVDEERVTAALETLQRDYDGSDASGRAPRGFELRRTARGWQFSSRAVFEPVVSAFVTDGQTARLSQAALEALAIIAYRQPIIACADRGDPRSQFRRGDSGVDRARIDT